MPYIVLLVSVALVAIDQILKILVVQFIKPVGSKIVIDGLLNLTYVPNYGAAFSILQNQRWLFVGITVVICAAIIFMLFRYDNHEFFSYAASILIIGGGIGNMIDRIFHGYVVDYIHLSFFPAIFNFGDCCVTVGTAFLILHVLLYSDKRNNVEKVMRTK